MSSDKVMFVCFGLTVTFNDFFQCMIIVSYPIHCLQVLIDTIFDFNHVNIFLPIIFVNIFSPSTK